MKKFIIGFILGGILFGSITLVSAYAIYANDIAYTPNWKKENGEDITNLKEALDELYKKSNNTIIYGEDESSDFDTFKEINLGFKPKAVMAISESRNVYLRAYLYSNNKECVALEKGDGMYHANIDNAIKVTDTGFKWLVKDSSWGGPQKLYYYAVK